MTTAIALYQSLAPKQAALAMRAEERIKARTVAEAITAFLAPRLADAPPSPPRQHGHARTEQPADGESPARQHAEVIALTPSPVPSQKEHAR